MAPITSKNAALFYEGNKIAKVTNCSIELTKETLDNTTVEKYYKTFVSSIKSANGSATVLYDPNDAPTLAILNAVFSQTAPAVLLVNLDSTLLNKTLTMNILINQVSLPLAVGEVIACGISFQVTGSITGTF